MKKFEKNYLYEYFQKFKILSNFKILTLIHPETSVKNLNNILQKSTLKKSDEMNS
jgi:hypothetical protein